MSTPIFICGAECGQAFDPNGNSAATHWTVQNSLITASTATVRSGLRSWRVAPSEGQGHAVHYLPSATRRLIGRFYFRFNTFPTQAGSRLIAYLANVSGDMGFYFNTATSKIEAFIYTGTVQAGPTLALNTWYRLDFDFNSSGATATIDWQVDGVAQTQATNVQAASDMIDFDIQLNATDGVIFYDDIILSATAADYPFGAGKVIGYSPDADGIHSFNAGDFLDTAGSAIAAAATTVYTYIDELPLSGTADWLVQNVVNTAGYIEIGFADTYEIAAQAATVEGLEIVVMAGATTETGTNLISAKINDGGTLAAVFTDFNVSSTALYSLRAAFATAPSSSAAWTPEKIDALKVRYGYAGDVSPPCRLHAVVMEVAWSGPTAPKGAGFIWVEGTDFHYIDASNQERLVTGSTTA